MAKRKTAWDWVLFVNCACVKSLIDIKAYVQHGTVDTWVHGWQPLTAHPIAACGNAVFDALAVYGMLLNVRDAVRERRRNTSHTETPAA